MKDVDAIYIIKFVIGQRECFDHHDEFAHEPIVGQVAEPVNPIASSKNGSIIVDSFESSSVTLFETPLFSPSKGCDCVPVAQGVEYAF